MSGQIFQIFGNPDIPLDDEFYNGVVLNNPLYHTVSGPSTFAFLAVIGLTVFLLIGLVRRWDEIFAIGVSLVLAAVSLVSLVTERYFNGMSYFVMAFGSMLLVFGAYRAYEMGRERYEYQHGTSDYPPSTLLLVAKLMSFGFGSALAVAIGCGLQFRYDFYVSAPALNYVEIWSWFGILVFGIMAPLAWLAYWIFGGDQYSGNRGGDSQGDGDDDVDATPAEDSTDSYDLGEVPTSPNDKGTGPVGVQVLRIAPRGGGNGGGNGDDGRSAVL